MKRRSYYPHNQQIVSTMTATSASRPSTPAGEQVDSRVASVDVMPPLPATKMVPLEKSDVGA